jgi:hypothetical protein
MFCYYKSEVSGDMQGHFLLNDATGLKINQERQSDFSICLPERIWYFRASSDDECKQ